MYLRGQRQSDIAAHLGITQQQVSYDLSILQKRWQKAALHAIDARKGEELARVDALEREYWLAWHRSQEQRESSLTERTQVDAGERTKAQLRREEQVGDPRFLQGIQWCINKRCEILGLNAPAKIAPTDAEGKKTYEFVVTYADRANTYQPAAAAPEAG